MRLRKGQPATFQEQTVPRGARLVGVAALAHEFDVAAPVRRPACVAEQHVRGSRRVDGGWSVFDKRYWPGEAVGEHLEFLLRHEDIDLLFLKRLFVALPPAVLEEMVRAAPAATHVRRAWCFYETLTGRTLDVPDAPRLPAVDLLDPSAYYTGQPRLSKRHREIGRAHV